MRLWREGARLEEELGVGCRWVCFGATGVCHDDPDAPVEGGGAAGGGGGAGGFR
jgi:hypothetical protein